MVVKDNQSKAKRRLHPYEESGSGAIARGLKREKQHPIQRRKDVEPPTRGGAEEDACAASQRSTFQLVCGMDIRE